GVPPAGTVSRPNSGIIEELVSPCQSREEAPVETATMGKVLLTVRIENLRDLYDAKRGLLPEDKVRRIEITDAVADTGAMMLSLSKPLIDQLGLERQRTRRIRTPSGTSERGVYEAVRVTVQDRDCTVDVLE